MKIAVLGLGRMGQGVARRLLEGGHEVAVWNRTPARAPEVVAAGAHEATSIEEVLDGVAVAISSLANDDAVRHVAYGDAGIEGALGPDCLYVDASTISPGLSTELAGSFANFLAMPILGNPEAVLAGRAIYLVGGEAGSIGKLEPLLADLSATVFRYGSASLAMTAKLTVNLLLLDAVVALAESFAVGRAGGLSDDQLRELLGASPMVAAGLNNRFEAVLTGELQPWWSPSLGSKDAGLAVALARGAGTELPLTATAVRLYCEAAALAPDTDIAAVARLYDAR